MSLFKSPFLISSLLVGLSSFCFGLFVLLKAPKKRLNQLWFIFSLSVAVWGFGGIWGATENNPHLALPKWRAVGAMGITWIAVLYFHFVCHFLGIKRPWILRVSYLIGTIFAGLYLTPLIFSEIRYVWNEIHWPLAGPLHPLFFLLWSGLIFYTHWELWLYYRQCSGIRKSQIRLFFLASAIGYSCGSLEYLPDYKIDLYPWANFGVALYPYIMTYAILQYRLFDISLVIRRSLVYSALVTMLTVGYFGLVYGIERTFQTTLGYHSVWVSLTAFALMALAFQPLKVWTQRGVDWLIFRVPQEELVKRVERLEQEALQTEKLKAISTLAAGMAHEIKNPLTAIKTFSESVSEFRDDPTFMKQYNETMPAEISRIQRIVQDLLNFAKPKPPELKPVEMGPLIHSTVSLLSSELSKRHIHWAVTCRHNGAAPQADADQIRQVLINLIQNAADAMPEGGTLTLATRTDSGCIEMAVSDTGQGIPKELLPRIFDPFVTTKEHGTGLGLAMVQSIIRAHRGTIRADSRPGRGTTFTVRLPL